MYIKMVLSKRLILLLSGSTTSYKLLIGKIKPFQSNTLKGFLIIKRQDLQVKSH
jgi:hypothetical protein